MQGLTAVLIQYIQIEVIVYIISILSRVVITYFVLHPGFMSRDCHNSDRQHDNCFLVIRHEANSMEVLLLDTSQVDDVGLRTSLEFKTVCHCLLYV